MFGQIPNAARRDTVSELAASLTQVDLDAASGPERIAYLQLAQRLASHYSALAYEAMASISELMEDELADDLDLAHDAAAAEIRAALRLTRRTADAELAFAVDLKRRLPGVFELLRTGMIDLRRARVIVNTTSPLPAEVARRVLAEVLDDAPALTTGQLRARLRRLSIDADPDWARDMYEQAVDDRRVVVEPTLEGTANLFGLDLPPDRVMAAAGRINDIARSLNVEGETRSMDQLRADVLLDLLEGTNTAAKGTVEIRVGLEVLAKLSESGADLAGYGPVVADIARQVAEQQPARWRYAVEDGDGTLVAAGTTRRRPLAAQQRHVELSNPTCVFPGCRMPATQSDLDHTKPFSEGGATEPGNLAPLCRHDHRVRHDAGWSYERLLNGGFQWTSRLGQVYATSGRGP
jgi:hypothetical protein